MLGISFRKVVYLIALFSEVAFVGACRAEDVNIVTSTYKSKNYHHLQYSLAKENIVSATIFTKEQFYINGGQFDVLIAKNKFPVAAPNCKSEIILRMPWTNSEHEYFGPSIEKKYEVYRSILEILRRDEGKKLDVYIELNPYVGFRDGKLQLTQCNVFFRHQEGRYVASLRAIK